MEHGGPLGSNLDDLRRQRETGKESFGKGIGGVDERGEEIRGEVRDKQDTREKESEVK